MCMTGLKAAPHQSLGDLIVKLTTHISILLPLTAKDGLVSYATIFQLEF